MVACDDLEHMFCVASLKVLVASFFHLFCGDRYYGSMYCALVLVLKCCGALASGLSSLLKKCIMAERDFSL